MTGIWMTIIVTQCDAWLTTGEIFFSPPFNDGGCVNHQLYNGDSWFNLLTSNGYHFLRAISWFWWIIVVNGGWLLVNCHCWLLTTNQHDSTGVSTMMDHTRGRQAMSQEKNLPCPVSPCRANCKKTAVHNEKWQMREHECISNEYIKGISPIKDHPQNGKLTGI